MTKIVVNANTGTGTINVVVPRLEKDVTIRLPSDQITPRVLSVDGPYPMSGLTTQTIYADKPFESATICFDGVSFNGATAHIAIRLANTFHNTVATTGYTTVSYAKSDLVSLAVGSGTFQAFLLYMANASRAFHGNVQLYNISNNHTSYVSTGSGRVGDPISTCTGVFKGETSNIPNYKIDAIEILRSSTDTFDAGNVTVIWEYA